MKPYTIIHGDGITEMRKLPANSVDAIVTDPPYHLTNSGGGPAKGSDNAYSRSRAGATSTGFMGQEWDGGDIAFRVELWAEALRVLKPGGHLLAFSGTRTQHRMVCAIEDAGFEIRDQIMWVYSSGFPKSHNLDRLCGKEFCGCTEGGKPPTECNLRAVLGANVSPAVDLGEGRGEVLQPCLSQQGASTNARQQLPGAEVWLGQPGLEGRRDHLQEEGQLQERALLKSAGLGEADGSQGRLRDGAPAGDGGVVRLPPDADGSGASHRSRSASKRSAEPGAVAGQPQSQALGAWPICGECALPMVPKGLGTALKPAHEPICVARKPFPGTVAANVLAHGTGAINIDACRVSFAGDADAQESKGKNQHSTFGNGARSNSILGDMSQNARANHNPPSRWPANLIHDGSAEVVALFPEQQSGSRAAGVRKGMGFHGADGDGGPAIASSTGSAARFFYCAKTSSTDRHEGLEVPGPQFRKGSTLRDAENLGCDRKGNHHPTVKPTDLMAYLVRLVTPPGGLVLDPFMGSGSTGKACMREGFRFVGIDMTAEYIPIATARIEFEHAKVTAAAELAAIPAPQLDMFSGEAA